MCFENRALGWSSLTTSESGSINWTLAENKWTLQCSQYEPEVYRSVIVNFWKSPL